MTFKDFHTLTNKDEVKALIVKTVKKYLSENSPSVSYRLTQKEIGWDIRTIRECLRNTPVQSEILMKKSSQARRARGMFQGGVDVLS